MFLRHIKNFQKKALQLNTRSTFKSSKPLLQAQTSSQDINPYTEQMYNLWKSDPNLVDYEWQTYFSEHISKSDVDSTKLDGEFVQEQTKLAMLAFMMTRRYIAKGHELAELDPLNLKSLYGSRKEFGKIQSQSTIEDSIPNFQDLLDKPFSLKQGDYLSEMSYFMSEKNQWTLREILDKLKQIYTGKIGWEYGHIENPHKRAWLQENIEKAAFTTSTTEQKLKTWKNLAKNEALNQFFKQKFSAVKRFGIEGCDSLISGLETLVDTSVDLGVENIVIGMPHRGRLNTMACVLGKPLEELFGEFQDKKEFSVSAEGWGGAGDVKYHLGVIQEKQYGSKKIQMRIMPNPSHLEAVNPCVYGTARAIKDHISDQTNDKTMGILIHGDSAFAGQGVVYESLQFGDLNGYKSGGTIHVIVNNQIGFTTTPAEFRSGYHSTELAKVVEAPIFHVNADHPDQVDRVMKLAMEYRQKFKEDVFIDIVGYRRAGHNEQDQPLFTQPMMYRQIQIHPPVMDLYTQKLIQEGLLNETTVRQTMADFMNEYDDAYMTSKQEGFNPGDYAAKAWESVKKPQPFGYMKNTNVSVSALQEIGKQLTTIPESFNAHKLIRKIFKARWDSIESGQGIDIATAESLAFGSLLQEGFGVRLSGQDVERGTFSQRHSRLWDQTANTGYVPFQSLLSQESLNQNKFTVVNSSLSEFGVLGFEYGYSITNPNFLTIWEAQFGDFANGAQVMIDNFISTGETKWGIQSGLVMMLPHGMDGQGAEHSSARLERFLSLSDDNINQVDPKRTQNIKRQIRKANWQIVNVSTSVNYFHALRRQLRRDFRKPLVMFNSKKLLRFKKAASDLQAFEDQIRFQTVYPETYPENLVKPEEVKLVAICSGQVYYDILQRREELQNKEVAIIRLEQFSPFPYDYLKENIAQYKNAKFTWVQEEHRNNGGWEFVEPRIDLILGELHSEGKISERQWVDYNGRKVSASPATGSASIHAIELDNFLTELFTKYKN